MNQISVAGRLTRDAETRAAGSDTVTGFSVAEDVRGPGGAKSSQFFDCSVWGKRGAALEPHLRKGSQVTVWGSLTTREHNGKTYMQIKVSEIALQGGGKATAQDAPAPQAAPTGEDYGSQGGGDDIPF